MAEDNDLEKRAIEELLKETDRARVRAETMGPAGWLKCPLRSTNKRFLLNTLRSTGMQRRNDEPRTTDSKTRGRLTHKSRDRRRGRSSSPPRYRAPFLQRARSGSARTAAAGWPPCRLSARK
uniref:Si:ch211-140b10.6 n=1 Tax=Oryzias melastigma TaxID=30732 RepID=A0A3B3BN41_ORYME